MSCRRSYTGPVEPSEPDANASSPGDPASATQFARSLRIAWLGGAEPTYWLTRMMFLRGLGFIYTIAFAIACAQWRGLIGSHGLLPAQRFVESIEGEVSFFELPSLLRFDASDSAISGLCVFGLGLSIIVMVGLDSGAVLLVLWLLYMSLSHVGQIFWGYGWEILLLEAGFLAIFAAPFRGAFALRSASPPPAAVMFLLRWLLCRLMLGAGLIKLRGDPCWRELTCLAFHYETQPVPSPVSWLLHQLPLGFHEAGVAFNHLVELVVPLLLLGPRPVRHVAGALTVVFQMILIISGNLSFLNWLTLIIAIACFDDGVWARALPARMARRAAGLEAAAVPRTRFQRGAVIALCIGVAVLSIGPVVNMLSPRQAMNTSFDPLHLVNSYGAFGSVGRVRQEIIIEGTLDQHIDANTRWREYEFPCKPGRVTRRPCLITPYHYRLDWQMWFAAMSQAVDEPWLMHLAYDLLQARPEVLGLLAYDPFGGKPPRFVRMELYEYHFTKWGSGDPAWWQRKRVGTYLPPVSADTPALLDYLRAYGLEE